MEEEIRQLTAIYDMVTEFIVNYSFQVLGALLIVLIGFWAGGKVAGLVTRLCSRHQLDPTLSRFFANLSKILVVAVMAIVALGKVGISIGPFVAALGAASLGAGLALQSPLSNYGAGLNLILTRPFVVGDTISINGISGIVREIKLAHTLLSDEDGVEIAVPNRHIIGEVIHNSRGCKLIELSVGISYQADADRAIALIRKTLAAMQIDGGEAEPEVGIDTFGDSTVNLAIRLWAPTEQHYRIRYRANGEIYRALKSENIEIAFPQREVRILSS